MYCSRWCCKGMCSVEKVCACHKARAVWAISTYYPHCSPSPHGGGDETSARHCGWSSGRGRSSWAGEWTGQPYDGAGRGSGVHCRILSPVEAQPAQHRAAQITASKTILVSWGAPLQVVRLCLEKEAFWLPLRPQQPGRCCLDHTELSRSDFWVD